jgi:N-acetylneuraminic acid mutarotase
MLSTILLFLFSTNAIAAWSGIVMDGYHGNTQLYVPGNPPINTSDINFGLSHIYGQAAVMLNGRAYFIGGTFVNDPITNAVTIFNPLTNTSTTGAPLNVARYVHAATVVGDTIIVCGGYNGSYLASCEQYNPSTQTWNMITSLPTPLMDFVMVTLNIRAYTFGGIVDCTSSSPVYMFDGQNWDPQSSIAGLPYRNHAGVAIDADRALICGGLGYRGGSCQDYGVSDCFIYSAMNNSWTQAASMAQIRCSHSMVLFEGECSKNGLKKL